MSILMLLVCAALPAQTEYDLQAQVVKDFTAKDFVKAIEHLDEWSRRFPQSAFADERHLLYVQVHAASGQHAKALDAGATIVTHDFKEPDNRLRLLYTLTAAVPQVADPTDAQQATGSRAAQQLASYDKQPAGTTAADWERARADLRKLARAAEIHLAILPATRAMKRQDCSAAAASAKTAAALYPDNLQAVWSLATAQLCLARSEPALAPEAIFQFARAAALDPSTASYLEKLYTQYHGADPGGLKQLKELAAASPQPPAGFTIQSKAQIALEQQADFESKNPELALWQRIRDALAAENGEQYFASDVKGAAVPHLIGTLAAAKPACRPTELMLGEIRLKLSKPLPGRPELNTQLRWEGVPIEFTRQPFLLTMATEPARISGLRLQPCR